GSRSCPLAAKKSFNKERIPPLPVKSASRNVALCSPMEVNSHIPIRPVGFTCIPIVRLRYSRTQPIQLCPVVLKFKDISSHSPAPCLILSSLDPLSYIGRAIFDRYGVRLAAGEKCHCVLVDERHVPQIQDQLLTRCLQGERLL